MVLLGFALVNAVTALCPSEVVKYTRKVPILCIDQNDLLQSAFQFTCQDCPKSQMQPSGIGNTAGFEMWVAAAQYSSSGYI